MPEPASSTGKIGVAGYSDRVRAGAQSRVRS
jgi:hypothetical protein